MAAWSSWERRRPPAPFASTKYLVTVGRFRQFVTAWNGGWVPPASSGKHTHVNGGQRPLELLDGGGYEPGWNTADNVQLSPRDANLTSCFEGSTWTSSAGSQENMPMLCVNWYEAYAFCIWDGGFLPSEVEWQFASAAGTQYRYYPWGWTRSGTNSRVRHLRRTLPGRWSLQGSLHRACGVAVGRVPLRPHALNPVARTGRAARASASVADGREGLNGRIVGAHHQAEQTVIREVARGEAHDAAAGRECGAFH